MPYSDYFTVIDPNLSPEEKISLIKNNISQAIIIRNKIDELSFSNEEDIFVDPPHEIELPQTVSSHPKSPQSPLFNQISLLKIGGLDYDAALAKISDIIKGASPLEINRIKLSLYKEFILYSKMLLSATTKNEIAEIEHSLSKIETKISLLDESLNSEETLPLEDASEEKNIFFLLSSSGKPIVYESLRKNVPPEFYPVFKSLIIDLKHGHLKGYKKLRDICYSELRAINSYGPAPRVTIDKIGRNSYIIIDAFLKKISSVNHYYSQSLTNRELQYLRVRSMYRENCENPDFIAEHQEYFTSVLNLLDGRELERSEESVRRNR